MSEFGVVYSTYCFLVYAGVLKERHFSDGELHWACKKNVMDSNSGLISSPAITSLFLLTCLLLQWNPT